jgi:xanthine/uracil permease
MIILLALLLVYALGFFLSYSMLRIEHEAEGRLYTFGDRLANISFSIGSILTILIVLVITWIKHIGQLGYWTRPIKPEVKKEGAK